MRTTRHWLWCGVVLLLMMGSQVFASSSPGATGNAPTEPSDDMRAWLGQDTGAPLTCADVVHMARELFSQEIENELLSDADECIAPFAGMNRTQGWVFLSGFDEDEDTATGDQVVIIPNTLTDAEVMDGAITHDHNAGGSDDHTHGDGAIAAHGNWSDYYTFRWRHAGEEQDHIKVEVEIDHHQRHFHYARNFEASLHKVNDRHHQYRNYAAGGRLGGKEDSDDSDPVYKYYRMTVEYEYRYCPNRWWCFESWEDHRHSSTCRAKSHNYWFSRSCYLDD